MVYGLALFQKEFILHLASMWNSIICDLFVSSDRLFTFSHLVMRLISEFKSKFKLLVFLNSPVVSSWSSAYISVDRGNVIYLNN